MNKLIDITGLQAFWEKAKTWVLDKIPTDIVRTSAQTLTDAEKRQARNNIGANPNMLVAYGHDGFVDNKPVAFNTAYQLSLSHITESDDWTLAGSYSFSSVYFCSSVNPYTIYTIADIVDTEITLVSGPPVYLKLESGTRNIYVKGHLPYINSITLYFSTSLRQLDEKYLPDTALTTNAQSLTFNQKSQVAENLDNFPDLKLPPIHNGRLCPSAVQNQIFGYNTRSAIFLDSIDIAYTGDWEVIGTFDTTDRLVSFNKHLTTKEYNLADILDTELSLGSDCYLKFGSNFTISFKGINTGYVKGLIIYLSVGIKQLPDEYIQENIVRDTDLYPLTNLLGEHEIRISDLETLNEGVDDRIEKAEKSLLTKVDAVEGKGLSTNDYTTEEKNKLAGLSSTGYDDTELRTMIENTVPVKSSVDELNSLVGLVVGDIAVLHDETSDTLYKKTSDSWEPFFEEISDSEIEALFE